MIAIDTNIVVRFVVNDDASQALRARAFISDHPTLLLSSVALETEWVLRSVYKLDRLAIHDALVRLCGLNTVSPERPAALAEALELFRLGADFGDAMHIAHAAKAAATEFATFDVSLKKYLQATSPVLKFAKL